MKLHAESGSDLQSLVDGLAVNGGGTLTLERGATFENVSILMPWRPDLRYANVRIIGDRTRLIGRKGFPLLHVGGGCPDYELPKLTGFELHGLDFDIQGDGVTIQQTFGALVDDCTFSNSAREALVTGGADSTVKTVVRNCHAKNCGKGYPSGPLAAFNMNCWGGRLEGSTAEGCGLFGEFGGTGTRITFCNAVDSPVRVGSSNFGCSDLTFTFCRFERSWIECDNPIGRMGDIKFTRNVFNNSPLCWGGAATTDKVPIKALPFSDRRSRFAANIVTGNAADWTAQGLRLTNWAKDRPSPSLEVVGNEFHVPPGLAVVSQGYPSPVAFEDNAWPEQWRTIYRTLPDQTPLPDPLPHWTVKGRN